MKKQIVERLLKDGHISFDEALELMDKQEMQTIIVQPGTWTAPDWQPYIQPQYPSPNAPWYVAPQITC